MLRGAVDGLNVVAPVGDENYLRLRPTIGLATPGTDDGALDLDGYFGLHPALATAAAAVAAEEAGLRPRQRLARHHPLALRRAGLHGIGHARAARARRTAG